MFADNEALAALWALAQRRLTEGEVLELPPGVQQQEVAFFLQPSRPPSGPLQAAPARPGVATRSADQWHRWHHSGRRQPLRRADAGQRRRFRSRHAAWRGRVDGSNTEASAGAPLRYIAAEVLPAAAASPAQTDIERVELRSEHLELSISALTRPAWAKAIGRDARGLFAEVGLAGAALPARLAAAAAGADRTVRTTPGSPVAGPASSRSASIATDCSPRSPSPCCSQRFRWMAPGHFLMGSPPPKSRSARTTKYSTK